MSAVSKCFHGNLTREESEVRLNASRARYPTQNIYLLRKSPKDPNNYVLSLSTALKAGGPPPSYSHFIVRTIPSPPSFYLEIPSVGPTPRFSTLDQLLDYYKDPAAGHPAPLGIYVPNADMVQSPPQQSQPPPQQFNTLTDQMRSLNTPSLGEVIAANHPALVPMPQKAEKLRESNPDTGMRYAAGGGIFPEEKPESHSDEFLLCEGYLDKKRGTGKTRNRWFRLTSKRFAYFTEDAGEVIGTVSVSDIAAVIDLSKTEFRVVTKQPFGAGNNMEVVLEASSAQVKNKWMAALKNEDLMDGGFRRHDGRLMVEGYLVKVKPFGTTNKTRWFACTDRHFGYYQEEAGELMGSVDLDNITHIGVVDSKTFKVSANTRFTVTGSYDVECRCETEGVRNKWLTQMQRVIPREKFQR